MSIKVLINSCPHRGNKVCFAEAGNARGFVCNYHGWAFGPDGALRGMHELKPTKTPALISPNTVYAKWLKWIPTKGWCLQPLIQKRLL